MTSPIQSPTVKPVTPAASAQTQAEHAKIAHAAKEFEAAMLRSMLKSVEKSMAGKGSGASQYASMQVGALADALSAAGGIGLAQTIVEQLGREENARLTKGLPEGAVRPTQEALDASTLPMNGSRSKK